MARIAGAAAVATALFTMQFEGFSNKVYRDPVGHLAACVGRDSIGPDGKPLRLGDTYTDDACSYMLGQDISTADKAVNDLVHVPLSDGERVAYDDFVFNAGRGAFAGSTVLRKLNAEDHTGACHELLAWDKGTVNGKKVTLPGLQKRRTAEMKACLGP